MDILARELAHGDNPVVVTEQDDSFVHLMTEWLGALPHDLKVLIDALDDENLPSDGRKAAAAGLVYVVSTRDAVRDTESFASFADDCIVLRLAAQEVIQEKNEDTEFFVSRFPDFFSSIDDEIGVCRSALGEAFPKLEAKWQSVKGTKFKGKSMGQFVESEDAAELLYDNVLEFRADYPVDETMLSDKFKRAATITEAIKAATTQIRR